MGWLTRARKFVSRVFHPHHGGGSFTQQLFYLSGQAAAGDMGFVVGAADVRENQGFARLGVRRSGGNNYDISVDYELEALDAVEGLDYSDVSGTLFWAEGDQDDKFIEVPLIDNFGADPTPRAFRARLVAGSETGHCHIKSPNTCTVTIYDDDVGAISISVYRPQALRYDVLETSAFVRVRVIRGGSLLGAVSVDYHTVNGTASAGTHYTNTTGTLNWADGIGGGLFVDIPIIDNGATAGDVGFTLVLDTPGGNSVVDVGYGTVLINIIDDESVPAGTPGEVGLVAANYSVNEHAGTLTLSVSRVNGSLGSASVDYEGVDGTGVQGQQYSLTPGTLSWANGESGPKDIVVTIIDNAIPFGDRAFQVQLLNEVGVAMGVIDLADVLIQDDDALVDVILQGMFSFREEVTCVTETDMDCRTEVVLFRPFGMYDGAGGSIGPSKPTASHYHSPDLTISGQLSAPRPKAGRIQMREIL